MGLSQEEIKERIVRQQRYQENLAQTAIAFIRQRFTGATVPDNIPLKVNPRVKRGLLMIEEYRMADTCDLHSLAVAVLRSFATPVTMEVNSREMAIAVIESNKERASQIVADLKKQKRRRPKEGDLIEPPPGTTGFNFCGECTDYESCREKSYCFKSHRKHRERGQTLFVAIMGLMLVSGLGLALMARSLGETRRAGSLHNSTAAFYAAMAGVEEVRDRLRPSSASPLVLPTDTATIVTLDMSRDSIAPYPYNATVTLRWKTNASTPYLVDTTQPTGDGVCWNGTHEYTTPTNDCGLDSRVYLVQSVGEAPLKGIKTITHAVRTVEAELTLTTPIAPANFFAASPACNALQIGGSGKTGSFNSQTSTSNLPSNQSAVNGDVAARGGLFFNGANTQINGTSMTTLPAEIGTCPASGIATQNNPVVGPLKQITPWTPIVPALPVTPTGAVTWRNTTVTPGTYGNVTLQSTVILTGGTQASPAIYNVNSMVWSTSSPATLVSNGWVVININGAGVTAPFKMTGGTLSNGTNIPAAFTVNYGGAGNVIITGSGSAFAFINAPQAPMLFVGGSRFYGAAVGLTLNDLGGTSLYNDESIRIPGVGTGPATEIVLHGKL